MMNEWNLTPDEKQNASKLEKDLLQRTLDLNSMSIGTNNDTTILKDNVKGLSDTVSAIAAKQHKADMEVKLLMLRAAEKISVEEFRSLVKMMNSPDGENLHVAYETIINLLADL